MRVTRTGKIALTIGLGLVAMLVTNWPARWISTSAGAWSGPLTIAGLAVALLSLGGAFWLKRHSWLFIAPAEFGLGLSWALAVFENWHTQIETALVFSRLALFAGGMIALAVMLHYALQTNSTYRDITSEMGEAVESDVPFRDDGERIEVYPRRRKMLNVSLHGAILSLLYVGGVIWMIDAQSPLFVVAAVCVVGALFPLTGALWLIRLAMRTPSLVIGPDGIDDRGSALVTGRGLLAWNEILGVFVDERKAQFTTSHPLGIVLADMRAVRARQPLWKRPLLLLFGQLSPIHIVITEPLLNAPTTQVAARIEAYARLYAPPESWHANWNDEPPVARRRPLPPEA